MVLNFKAVVFRVSVVFIHLWRSLITVKLHGLRDWIVRLFVGEILGPPTRLGGGGVLLYISYIGVCHPKGRYRLIGKLRVMVPV